MDNKDKDNNKNINKGITPGGGKKKKEITENELKMPIASGEGKGPKGTGKEKKPNTNPQPEGTTKLPQREEPGFSEQNEGSYSPSGKTGSTIETHDPAGPKMIKGKTVSKGAGDKEGKTTAKVKKPAKITQAAKGRFEDRDENTGNQSENGSSLPGHPAKDTKALPKKGLPKKTSSEEKFAESKASAGKKVSPAGKSLKAGTSAGKKVKPSAKKTPGKAKARDESSTGQEVKRSGKSRSTEKNSIGKKPNSDDNSIVSGLKDLAKAAAMKVAKKILPDEDTRENISKTAKDILPNNEDISKAAKDLKNKFSPEVEPANNATDKTVPRNGVNEKSNKVKDAARQIKERNTEKAAEKKFDEISLISEFDIHLFKEGKHFHLYKKLGSHPMDFDGVSGVYFALWAPNAKNVSVIGDFNDWYKQANPMNSRPDGSGIWEIFIPEAKKGSIYKYFVQSTSGYEAEKGDPYAFMWEVPPHTASVVWDLKSSWNDSAWMSKRKANAGKAKPVSVYELHVGSWKRVPEEGNRSLSYRELADQLPKYLNEMGFTHVEFMPVMEHPFFGSWGYQVTGYFAPSSRFGSPQDFMHLIDELHQAGIGVILDWVPSHFPSDLHGLHYYDGTHLYEHEDPQKGFHPDWKSYIFNFGRNEVRSFLISNALFWLDMFHVDGLRVDAVASMLYLDYSRKHGEWQPNEHGGNENLEAISFLKEFNEVVYKEFPDTITIAEESTAWPMVSKPTYMGGLGFGMKWMMGWMHDTLDYFQNDPIHRKHHQNTITFSTNYAFTENFMLPLSHDEVVYGKQSIWNKMPGDDWNKFANLRSLYAYMFAHPGTKLLFMGAEFAQKTEWDHDSSLPWHLTSEQPHQQIQRTISALNNLYKTEPALYEISFDPEGFEWIDFNDAESSVISFLRKGKDRKGDVLVVCNLTPVPRENYRIGVPEDGNWREIFNSDDSDFGGSNIKNQQPVKSESLPTHQKNHSISLNLPPMAVVYLKKDRFSKDSAEL
jgi:1,4-alpha-glucan branching enzyme